MKLTMNRTLGIAALSAAAVATSACTESADASASTSVETETAITEAEVKAAQKAWGDGIVAISAAHADKGDYEKVARNHLDTLYNYGEGSTVLFKPTLAAEDQFRGTYDEALSYFITGNRKEDTGFAIKGWTKVVFDNEGIVLDGDSATAMGNYFFTGPDGSETKVEYTFGYVKDEEGNLRINTHHSSMPFDPS